MTTAFVFITMTIAHAVHMLVAVHHLLLVLHGRKMRFQPELDKRRT
jgi:hypothetical protein